MHWPQYVMFGWFLFEAGAEVARHGQERMGTRNGFAAVIVYGLALWVMYMGDFFKG